MGEEKQTHPRLFQLWEQLIKLSKEQEQEGKKK